MTTHSKEDPSGNPIDLPQPGTPQLNQAAFVVATAWDEMSQRIADCQGWSAFDSWLAQDLESLESDFAAFQSHRSNRKNFTQR